MRRSLLFIPSNAPSMMQNADVFEADAVIFDLEDAVSLFEKDAALNLLEQFLNRFSLENIEMIVRINGLDTNLGMMDLNRIVSDKIDTIMLPKATFASTSLCQEIILTLENKKALKKTIHIIPIIEKAISLIEINDIAKLDRVDGLLLGAEDLATDLEVIRTHESIEILVPRTMVVYAAKAYGKDAIDTPYVDTTNQEGLKKDACFAKSLGMNAKACIHPNQIDSVNQIFIPSLKEISEAKKIMMAYEIAEKEGKGVFSVDGKMIDKPIIERAKKILMKKDRWNL
jgi:citrate lyase subunit beta / citryl-CoA lyase